MEAEKRKPELTPMASQAIEILNPAWLTPSHRPPTPEPSSVCLGLVSFFQLLTIVNLLAQSL